MAELYTYSESERLFAEAQDFFPGGTPQHRRALIPGGSPIYMDHGRGSHIWDVDGNEYIDYALSLGPIVLGYAYPRVNRAVAAAMEKGATFTLNHPIQNQLARRLVEIIPSADMVWYARTGSGATTSALRIARAHTGREKIIRSGYHGWHDWCVPGGAGVPKSISQEVLAWDGREIEGLQSLFAENPGEIACLIVAPESIRELSAERLHDIQRVVADAGAIWILDEIKTGFRMALGGVQEHFGVIPDLTTVSKAMANGWPIAAVVGRKEYMLTADKVWLPSTFNEETLSMVAALATIDELDERDGIAHFYHIGTRLIESLSNLAREIGVEAHGEAQPLPPMPFLKFDYEDEAVRDKAKEIFFREVIGRGVLFHPGHTWFLTLSHSDEDIDRSLEVAEIAFKRVKDNL
jgi:glutamate-1-semialdehyde 2,1-aminomutase